MASKLKTGLRGIRAP